MAGHTGDGLLAKLTWHPPSLPVKLPPSGMLVAAAAAAGAAAAEKSGLSTRQIGHTHRLTLLSLHLVTSHQAD